MILCSPSIFLWSHQCRQWVYLAHLWWFCYATWMAFSVLWCTCKLCQLVRGVCSLEGGGRFPLGSLSCLPHTHAEPYLSLSSWDLVISGFNCFLSSMESNCMLLNEVEIGITFQTSMGVSQECLLAPTATHSSISSLKTSCKIHLENFASTVKINGRVVMVVSILCFADIIALMGVTESKLQKPARLENRERVYGNEEKNEVTVSRFQ